jgi:MarR family transcriptional regulator for hemolysin
MQKMEEEGSWAPESLVGYWINRVSRDLVREGDARLRPLGFSMGQLPVLRALAPGPALMQRDLAREAGVEQPTMAELLRRMERDGVIERQANPDDGRGALISLAPRSRSRLKKARAALIEGERAATAGLTEDERRQLRGLLRRVARNLEDGAQAGGESAARP